MKSRSSLLAPAHLGGPGKRVVKWLRWWWWLYILFTQSMAAVQFSQTCWASVETPYRHPWCQQSVWNADRETSLCCQPPPCYCQLTASQLPARWKQDQRDHAVQTPVHTAAHPGSENASDQSRSGHTWLLNRPSIIVDTMETAILRDIEHNHTSKICTMIAIYRYINCLCSVQIHFAFT